MSPVQQMNISYVQTYVHAYILAGMPNCNLQICWSVLCKCMWTHTYTCSHIHSLTYQNIHTYTHTYIFTHSKAYRHKYADSQLTWRQACMHMHHAYIHTCEPCIYIHAHTKIHTYVHTSMLACKHTYKQLSYHAWVIHTILSSQKYVLLTIFS